VGKPDNPVLELAIQNTTDHFRLQTKVDAISCYDLKSVPFIPSSSAGWGYDGKKEDPGNHERAINRAVSSLYWWLETINGQTSALSGTDLIWHGHGPNLARLKRPRSVTSGEKRLKTSSLKE